MGVLVIKNPPRLARQSAVVTASPKLLSFRDSVPRKFPDTSKCVTPDLRDEGLVTCEDTTSDEKYRYVQRTPDTAITGNGLNEDTKTNEKENEIN